MWTPANIDALPSANEVECAKKAINELEDLLKAAVAGVEQAKLRVANLKKEIKVRRAWLAPIRKLPIEVLSEIFIHCSRMKAFMPVTITEVSRRWRRTILLTPKAWSIIDADCLRNDKMALRYVSTFMERSDPCTVHVRVDLDEDYNQYYLELEEHPLFRLINSATHRITCLCVPYSLLSHMNDNIFSNLTTLYLMSDRRIQSAYFSHSRFPHLRYLDSGDCEWTWFTDTVHALPPLEYLVIGSDDGTSYIEVIKACCTTLRGLQVRAIDDTPRLLAPVDIHFPLLKYLEVSPWRFTSIWPTQATTPVLRSYKETQSRMTEGILHKDVKKRHASSMPESSPAIPLCRATFAPTMGIRTSPGLVEDLRRHKEICPALESIEFKYRDDFEPKKKKKIELMIKTARPHIEVTFSKKWSDLPGLRHRFECDYDTWEEE